MQTLVPSSRNLLEIYHILIDSTAFSSDTMILCYMPFDCSVVSEIQK